MITGIILASGFSRRMGKDKLLLEIEGEKIIERVVRACLKSRLNNIMIIYRKEDIRKIGNRYGIRAVYNNNAYKGQSESVKLGVKNSDSRSSYMFILGDQPFINQETIDKLIERYKKTYSNILVPYYGGNRGTPVIISNRYREELLNIRGDIGARDIIKKNMEDVTAVYFEDEKLGMDIDSLQDMIFKGGIL